MSAAPIVRDIQSNFLKVIAWFEAPHYLIGASLLRICLGFIVFVFLTLHIPERGLLWGPAGVVTIPDFDRWFSGNHRLGFNLFTISSSQFWFETVFWSSLAIVLAYMLGYRTRLTAPLFAIVVWSIYHRNPWLTNGGTRLLCIVSIYLVLADVGRYFSIRSVKAQTKQLSPIAAMLHNTSAILIIIQLMIVYLFSTFYKIDGPSWQQGTGLYYSLMDPEFQGSPFVSLITHNPWLVTLGSYSTLLYQSAFPWLILNKRTKLFIVLVGLMFHFGIAVVMGLWWFSAVLMACETVIVTDAQYRSIFAYAQKVFTGDSASTKQTLRLENIHA